MRQLICLLFVALMVSLSSCRKDFDTVPSNGNLSFSKDTVYLDTVFTKIGSSTYTLKVYNNSNDDINIPTIRFEKIDSRYRMMVDGMTGIDEDGNGVGDGRKFNNVELLAKDSLYIFIETTADILELANNNPTEFLHTDNIVFDSGSKEQKVNLVTLIKDAYFLYPKRNAEGIKESLLIDTDDNGDEIRINGFELDHSDLNNGDEFHFNNTKPYVIYGYAGVPSGETLTIDPGARVYFHAESGILVQSGGSLQINGGISTDPANPQQNEVTFEGDRLEPMFEDVPGQWGTIWLRQGSVNNRVNHLTLKNSMLGFLVENCPLEINNSQIYNSANYGILSRAGAITSENLVINLAGQASLACSLGGDYQFKHGTFNNNWVGSNPLSVWLSNYEEQADGSKPTNGLLRANFYNCIIYGNNNVQLFLNDIDFDSSDVAFNYDFQNCLIKFRDAGTSLQDNNAYNFIREESNGNIKNQNPNFFDVNANKLNIDETSPAYQKGSLSFLVPLDILGHPRTSNPPDMGAYQSAAFPD
ncbi:hypothetical protein KIH23_12395 [Flavobacterium sp. CYK-55]|uniref:hypothetical protein n=1 Tax=Flavobacterium sp. CYK-55 TaxID=2835529 RepID=UPI001BCF1379|nr:hypothetical protein [Flavobacterium sp. CYK-55]MBS7788099.1 hypothetical protein [Flavobacterium sp. CYK-55]